MRLGPLVLAAALLVDPALALAKQPRERPRREEISPKRKKKKPVRRRGTLRATADLDRVVVRWSSRATGGVASPQFITARELAFEARLEALTEGAEGDRGYTDRHVRAAIQRHITETMLASSPVDPRPTPRQVASYAEAAREIILQRIAGGDESVDPDARRAVGTAKLEGARRAEGISRDELDAVLRRRARASWYLDKMIAPMLRPSELDLREAHRRGETPYTNQTFDQVRDALERWYVSQSLTTALERYFRNARARVDVVIIRQPRI
jgi:hypothetical protein